MDAHPPGTHYRIASGVHREQTITAKDGDRFLGESGAVLNGARDLSAAVVDWIAEDGHWYVDGQTQEGRQIGRIAAGGNQLDRHPEELFVEGARFEHVQNPAALRPGAWHFDYQRDRIWIGEDPAALGLIEASVAPVSITGRGVRDVKVENLVIEKYASPANHGAVGDPSTLDWELRYLTVRDNHGGGIRISPGVLVEHNNVHGNGQLGMVGSGFDEDTKFTNQVVIRHNEIGHNMTLDYDPEWAGGGLKVTETDSGIVVEQNWVHDNAGHGLWFDIDAYSATVRSNLVEGNARRGIFYEVSHGSHPVHGGNKTLIYWNEVRNNGWDADSHRRGVPVFISNSEEVEVYENFIHDNRGGILVREAGGRAVHVRDVVVRDNEVSYTQGLTGLVVEGGYSRADIESYARTQGVEFSGNAYHVEGDEPFIWLESTGDVGFWQQETGDGHSSFIAQQSELGLPDDARPFAPTQFGPRG